MLRGKKVLLGVTGSIAAYKATFLTRLFIKAGAEVKVILTPAARDFVTPLSLSTLSKNPVLWEYFDPEDEEGKWNNHVELALWADFMLIAPATANTLAKMTAGICDNLLMGVYLSAKCPVYFAPAMDLDMYHHPSTHENIDKLISFGDKYIPSGTGELASGLEGEGRLAEPEEIVEFIIQDLKKSKPLTGKKVLINGGPTYEAIDAVRFIGNHSSGKMGVALAEAASAMGAEVKLVLGPHAVRPSDSSIEVFDIISARDLLEKCLSLFKETDIAILSAAVSDYRPEKEMEGKIKKKGEALTLRLIENPDILYELGRIKGKDQVLAGFALETDNGLQNAIAKLHKKNCDLIVLNSPDEKGTGFGHDTNEVILINREEQTKKIELKEKREIAKEILEYIVDKLI